MDLRHMQSALGLARRAAGWSTPNPNVGCILVKEGRVIGRGWTGAGGRPHAEAMALAAAGDKARGATAFVTLEPCAHVSQRGPACADLLIGAGISSVVVAMPDPDPRTQGLGIARLKAAGLRVIEDQDRAEAEAELQGFRLRIEQGRPEITLKLAMSLDGRIALADGRSQWISGEDARRLGHLERARADAVVVGRGTFEADRPRLDVRLQGWTGRQPARVIVGHPAALPPGFQAVPDLAGLLALAARNAWLRLLVEGGGRLAGALLDADLVDRLLLFRAPILLGEARGVAGLFLVDLPSAHGRWQPIDTRAIGPDRVEEYRRAR